MLLAPPTAPRVRAAPHPSLQPRHSWVSPHPRPALWSLGYTGFHPGCPQLSPTWPEVIQPARPAQSHPGNLEGTCVAARAGGGVGVVGAPATAPGELGTGVPLWVAGQGPAAGGRAGPKLQAWLLLPGNSRGTEVTSGGAGRALPGVKSSLPQKVCSWYPQGGGGVSVPQGQITRQGSGTGL